MQCRPPLQVWSSLSLVKIHPEKRIIKYMILRKTSLPYIIPSVTKFPCKLLRLFSMKNRIKYFISILYHKKDQKSSLNMLYFLSAKKFFFIKKISLNTKDSIKIFWALLNLNLVKLFTSNDTIRVHHK